MFLQTLCSSKHVFVAPGYLIRHMNVSCHLYQILKAWPWEWRNTSFDPVFYWMSQSYHHCTRTNGLIDFSWGKFISDKHNNSWGHQCIYSERRRSRELYFAKRNILSKALLFFRFYSSKLFLYKSSSCWDYQVTEHSRDSVNQSINPNARKLSTWWSDHTASSIWLKRATFKRIIGVWIISGHLASLTRFITALRSPVLVSVLISLWLWYDTEQRYVGGKRLIDCQSRSDGKHLWVWLFWSVTVQYGVAVLLSNHSTWLTLSVRS